MAKIMRIEKNPITIFGAVEIGDYFEYKGDLFIRISGVETYNEKNELNYINAVNLNKNGELTAFDYNDEITMVDNNSVIVEYKLKEQKRGQMSSPPPEKLYHTSTKKSSTFFKKITQNKFLKFVQSVSIHLLLLVLYFNYKS